MKKLSILLQRKKNKYIKEEKKKQVSTNILDNQNIINNIYSSSLCKDIVIRNFNIRYNNVPYSSFSIFIDGLSDVDIINDSILRPLMQTNTCSNISFPDYIELDVLHQSSVKKSPKIEDIIKGINLGNLVIFIDTLDFAYVCDVKKYEHRQISAPNNEIAIKGPQVAFVESIRSNTALIRKAMSDEDLIFESIEVGKRSNTQCVIGYISSIANPDLVEDIRNRLNKVSIDYLFDSSQLEQLIEDHPLLLAPQFINTERPDKVTSHLAEGRVCIIVNNSPNVLILPSTFWDFFHSPEDYFIKFQFANFIRFIRLLAYFCSLFLPGIYIALTNFHVELLPTDLLFSIASIKETIPFPLVVEILIMELSLELIREAGARMPGVIGSSLGIVGAVLLGQATVDANLVSPMLILVVAITAISSFATPNYSLAFAFRLLRFVYIILASFMGFFGLFFGFVVHLIFISNMYTFGIPYLVGFDKYSKPFATDGASILPIWLERFRPPFLEPLDRIKNYKISRIWDKKG